MRTARRRHLLDIDTFIAWEDQQPEKHQLVGGEVYAMVGGALAHAAIALNMAVALRNRLRRPCQVFVSDVKVRVDAASSVYYPDVVVSCAGQDMRGTVLRDPVLVVEVLSPGTAAFDRMKKRADYATLPSVRYVLLVETEERLVELDRREGGDWLRETVTGEGRLDFPELGVSLDLDEIYGG
ncbi:Uma2 family endonuclease [Rhodospirillum centenum]|uniref:Putative restriction endonuclease domain-containing protein n=1 Tax=Rhodospirillum centenum (strain ATCC 51521 / SW) TaxID=414684 RepID=B6IVE8_RHOCS|nr:Uma2 family endonuclease [Rhodospirillum centenum]ACJ00272.1 conserved hypothetical protein [Rhodospirillum centenum SW]